MDTWSYDVASDLVKNKSDKKFLSDIGGRKQCCVNRFWESFMTLILQEKQ